MTKLKRLSLAALLVCIALSPSTLAKASRSAAQTLSMCRGQDGKSLTGEVDFLLLLDNSRSLNQKNGSDVLNKRYIAIKDMLSSVVSGLGSTNKVNFALTSFGSRVSDAIEFGAEPLSTAEDATNLTELVKEKVPGDYKKQEQTTDYVSALRHARDLFDARPAQNCKILVWFTDGVFESRETHDRDSMRQQASALKSAICGGIAGSFQEKRINSFALVLKPKSADKARLSASYSAMAALTGDEELPENIAKAIRPGDNCPGNPLHLGEVLLADDASAIGRYMPGIANIASGAEQATEQCPVAGNELDSLPLPAARHLEWISVENIEGSSLPQLNDFSIRSSTGDDLGVASKYLTLKSSSSEYEAKYSLNESSKSELNAGWQLHVNGGLTGLCLRAKPENFRLRFTSTSVAGVDKKSKLIEQDVNQMSFAINGDSSEKVFSLTEAATLAEEVVALLPIDTTGKIFSKPLEISVVKLDVATLSCESGLSFLNWQGTMPKSHNVLTQFCDVDVNGTGKTVTGIQIDSGMSADQLRDCGVVLTPMANLASGQTPTKGATGALQIQESSHLKFQVKASLGDTARCIIPGVKVNLLLTSAKSGNSTESVPLSLQFELKKGANPVLVLLFTILGLAVVILLNLLVLNFLMRKLITLPSVNDLKAIEVPLVLTRGQGGNVEALVNGEPLSAFRVSQENLSNISAGEGESLVVQRGNTVLRLDRPGIFKPLRTPVAVVHPQSDAVYIPNSGTDGGLAPNFSTALVFHSIRRLDDNSVTGTLTAFIPMNGPNGGLRGAQSLLGDQTKIREIARRGMEFLGANRNAGNSASPVAPVMNSSEPKQSNTPVPRALPKIPGQS